MSSAGPRRVTLTLPTTSPTATFELFVITSRGTLKNRSSSDPMRYARWSTIAAVTERIFTGQFEVRRAKPLLRRLLTLQLLTFQLLTLDLALVAKLEEPAQRGLEIANAQIVVEI